MTSNTCPHCEETFTKEASSREHCWDVHGACHHCGDEADDQETLYTHWLVLHDDELSRTDRNRAESAVGEPSFGDRLTHQGPAGAISSVGVSRRTLLGGGVAGLGTLIGAGIVTDAFGGDGADLADHPAATALETEPTLGPPPGDAEGTIIAFEDPSCPSCARFERDTFPKLESELVDPGTVTFVQRTIPIIREWSEPASLALEATYARDESAFWALSAFYYRSQSELGSRNVREMTSEFLTEETSVDGAAVADDIDGETHRDDVDADLQASRDAGVNGTPTFFLFRDGSFVTELAGPQSYGVFENSLGV